GLLRLNSGVAAEAMTQLGVTPDLARGEVIRMLTQAGAPLSESMGTPAASAPDESSGPLSAPLSVFNYLTVQTKRRAGEVVVDTVQGENMVEPGWEDAPIQLVLNQLGEQGWELMGIDATPGPGGGSLYVFKRRAE
ncbi:MAG: hypothetical protein M3Z66_23990, partial [Chloroflexota bacterium]|nr:hypothetical protein [Chloroflexota bacterium]